MGAVCARVKKGPQLESLDLALTDAKIRALKPKEKAYKTSDFGGLYLYVTAKGSRLWRLKYRYNGKEGKLSFGSYPDISLKEARDLRDEARGQLANGINPSALKREKHAEAMGKTENTFNRLADQYVEKLTKEGRAKSTLKKLEWLLEDARRDFGHIPIADITAPIVLKTLKKRERQEQYETAQRMRSRIGGVFRFAVATGVSDTDPTFALRDALISPTVKHRAAITDEAGLSRLLKAIEVYMGRRETIIALKLLLQFACRPGELRQARWEEFDFEQKIWSVPAPRMKTRKPHTVPLPETTLTLLGELKDLTGWGELLFPAQTSSKKPMSENTLNQALRRMGFTPEEVTSHGFRSTFSTFANESGLWSPDAIEVYCARLDRNVTRRAYNRSIYWEERVKIAQWWSGHLSNLAISAHK